MDAMLKDTQELKTLAWVMETNMVSKKIQGKKKRNKSQ